MYTQESAHHTVTQSSDPRVFQQRNPARTARVNLGEKARNDWQLMQQYGNAVCAGNIGQLYRNRAEANRAQCNTAN